MSIYDKLLNIQKQVLGLGKDKNGGLYEYVTGSKVLGAIKPLMCKEGLLLKQELVHTEKEVLKYSQYNKWQKVNIEKTEINYLCTFKFTWICVETGERDENIFMASGQNEFEKGIGSAMTYAERYFLLKFFHIATDSDDIDGMQFEGRCESIPETKEVKQFNKEKIIKQILDECERTDTDVYSIYNKAKVKSLPEISDADLSKLLKWLEKKQSKVAELNASDIDKVANAAMGG